MYVRNHQIRAWSDKVIAKIKWCSFLTHSVHCRPKRGSLYFSVTLANPNIFVYNYVLF